MIDRGGMLEGTFDVQGSVRSKIGPFVREFHVTIGHDV